uniref:Floricaula/leafy-like transcription factor n=1 Tax=Equisetum giganteum TaxID=3259 RepID=A0A8E7IJM2_EQUGI|nr:LEAFY 1 [Equisetum giganteum]
MLPNSCERTRSLHDFFRDYGVRPKTVARILELGFTVNTLVNMTDPEIDELVKTMVEGFRLELLVGERYGLKSAIRAERRTRDEDAARQHLHILAKSVKKRKGELDNDNNNNINSNNEQALGWVEGSAREQGGDNALMFPDTVTAVGGPLSLNTKDATVPLEQQNHLHFSAPGPLSIPEPSSDNGIRKLEKKKQKRLLSREHGEDADDRTREHPFIVTEPGELARGKKNGLDYLFDLYEQCGRFLEEVQQICKERGEKCPTKVTNQVFRHAKLKGASYINKPKMRHYVHCYALHCLDVEQSNRLRKLFKERGENVGAWRQACYHPLVELARQSGWDIEGLFNRNEKLRIWYVPTKLRQLCHMEKNKDSDSCSYD